MASARFYGTGRRKSSVARVYLTPGTGKITINKRDIDEYFGLDTLKVIVRQPLVATDTEGIRGKGVGFAFAIQVPGMAGAHTGSFFARGYESINLDSSGEESLLAIEGHTHLKPHVQVTTAGGPHVAATGGAIRFGMFVVKGQIQAQIHKLVKAHGGVHVARKRRSPVIKTISLAIGGIVTATAQGPSVESDIATRTDRESKLAISLGIVLMDTVSTTLDARLGKCEAAS
jgi:hypothetical protein